MDTTWAGTRYRTRLVHDDTEGWSAVELLVDSETEPAARVTYWDAPGQFTIEMFRELPLNIVEKLIAEARATIHVS